MAKKPTYEELEQRVKGLEKKASERKLTEKLSWEASYHEIFDTVNDGIFIHDKETEAILDVNKKACEFRRQIREEILNSSVGELPTSWKSFQMD